MPGKILVYLSPMICVRGTFCTVDGPVTDEDEIRKQILDKLKPVLTTGLAKTARNLMNMLRIECWSPPLPIQQDRIHFANGTLMLDSGFTADKQFCLNRLPVKYDPSAPEPVTWLRFLDDLLYMEDIPTLQEYMGYCLIPSTKDRPADRKDDPFLAEKLCAEAEGIVLWAIEGLRRLIANDFAFTVSDRARANLTEVKKDANNILDFLGSEGYIAYEPGQKTTAPQVYRAVQAAFR